MSSLPISRQSSPASKLSHPMGWVLICVLGASIMCGIVWHGRAYVMTGTLLLICVAGILLPYLSIRKLRAKTIPLEYRGQVGTELAIRIQVENRNYWPWGTTVVCLNEDRNAAQSASKYDHFYRIDRIGRVQTTSEATTMTPRSRGLFPASEGKLITRFPFGLMTAESMFPIAGQSIIWPEILPASGWISESGNSGYDASAASRHSWGDEGDIAGPRPYRPGESLRRIHWQHTARRGELIVSERETASSRRLRVCLELAPTETPSPTASEAYEMAISIAASLIWYAVANDWQVDFEFAGRQAWERIDDKGIATVLDYLATFDSNGPGAHPEPAEFRKRDALRTILVTQRKLTDSDTLSRYEQILCTCADKPDQAVLSRCQWLPPGSNWRETIQRSGEVSHG